MPSPVAVAIVLVVATVAPRAQQIWTVASGGGAQFTTIDAAITAAADGDVILVAQGNYAPFVIDGKGLHVIAAGGFVSNSTSPFGPAPPAVWIRNLAAGQNVRFSGMQVFCFADALANLLVQDCVGTVWLENLFCDSYGAPTLVVERSASVVLVDVFAQTNLTLATPAGIPVPGPGARIVDSELYAYDCEMRGSHGVLQGPGLTAPVIAADGGHGVEIVGSRVTLTGSKALPGSGTALFAGSCIFAGSGGDGALLQASATAQPELRHRDTAFGAGFTGWATPTCGTTPSPGLGVRVIAGQAIALPGAARLLRCGHDLVVPGTMAIEIEGDTGDVSFVFAAAPRPTVEAMGLSIHLEWPLIALGSAAAGLRGSATLTVPLPALPPGLLPFVGAVQAVTLDSSGGLVTTSPSTLVLR